MKLSISVLKELNACESGKKRFVKGNFFKLRVCRQSIGLVELIENTKVNKQDLSWLVNYMVIHYHVFNVVHTLLSDYAAIRRFDEVHNNKTAHMRDLLAFYPCNNINNVCYVYRTLIHAISELLKIAIDEVYSGGMDSETRNLLNNICRRVHLQYYK